MINATDKEHEQGLVVACDGTTILTRGEVRLRSLSLQTGGKPVLLFKNEALMGPVDRMV